MKYLLIISLLLSGCASERRFRQAGTPRFDIEWTEEHNLVVMSLRRE